MNQFQRALLAHIHQVTDGEGNDLGAGQGEEGKGTDSKQDSQNDEGKQTKVQDGGVGKTDPPADDKKPSDSEAKLLKEVMAKKEQNQKLTNELAELKRSVDGIDLDAVRQLLADKKDAETKELESKGDYDRLKQRMADEHAVEVARLAAENLVLKTQFETANGAINELTVGAKFNQSNFIKEELVLPPAKARALYGDYFDLEDGVVVGYDKPRGAASRTALVDAYGKPVAFDAAMSKIIEADAEKDHLLKSKGKQGAGSGSKTASKPITNETEKSGVNRIADGLSSLKI